MASSPFQKLLSKYYKNQKLILTLSAIGLILFIAISATFSFRNTLFKRLFPKPPSHAVARPPSNPTITQTATDLTIANNYYSVTFSKDNGSITQIKDILSNSVVSTGNSTACLWMATFQSSPAFGGCGYSSTSTTNPFTASAAVTNGDNSITQTFTYAYTAGAPSNQKIGATVTISASTDTYVDFKIDLTNNSGHTMLSTDIPYDLIGSSSTIKYGYATDFYPGVRLKPNWFSANWLNGTNCQTRTGTPIYCDLLDNYPSAKNFADFLAYELNDGGQFSEYSVYPSTASSDPPIQSAELGFVHGIAASNTFLTRHSFTTYVPNGSTYSSVTMRIRAVDNAEQAITNYRIDNGMDDPAIFPTLQIRMGANFNKFVSSLMVKGDLSGPTSTYNNLTARLDQLPLNTLYHLVNYEPYGFETGEPDVLPPMTKCATAPPCTAELNNFISAIHNKGMLVMPYTISVWWQIASSPSPCPTPSPMPDSPTVLNLPLASPPLTTSDVAIQPMSISTHHNDCNDIGFYVSPTHPYVKNIIDQKIKEWSSTGLVPVDYIFSDTLGYTSFYNAYGNKDQNPNASDPNGGDKVTSAFYDGWRDFIKRNTAPGITQGIGVEGGWDRLARYAVSFYDSILFSLQPTFPYFYAFGSNMSDGQSSSNWDPYPLGGWLYHDKVLISQHDLANSTQSTSKDLIRFNTAFGISNVYLWSSIVGSTPGADPFLDMVAYLQKNVLGKYLGQPMLSHQYLPDPLHAPDSLITKTTYATAGSGNIDITTNWATPSGQTYDTPAGTLVPGGFLAQTVDGKLTAGIFSKFNGQNLSNGDHYIFVENTAPGTYRIKHTAVPSVNSQLKINLPLISSVTSFSAYDRTGTKITGGDLISGTGTTSGTYNFTNNQLLFIANTTTNSTTIDYFEVTGPAVTSAAFFTLTPSSATVNVGQNGSVNVMARTDTDAANLFVAKLKFDPSQVAVTGISTSSGTFITQFTEGYYSNTGADAGTISIIGGVPNPGFQTSGTSAQMATIKFSAIAPGTSSINFDSTSAIYRNSDNVNILSLASSTGTNLTINAVATPTPTPTPTGTPSFTPTPTPSPIPTFTPTFSPTPTPTASPLACNISSAAWTNVPTNPVNQNTVINLVANATGDCTGKVASFAVWEDDSPLDADDPVMTNPVNASLVDAGGGNFTATTSWSAEYQQDGLFGIDDPPEYYFNVNLLGDLTTIRSASPEVQVLRAGGGTFPQAGDANSDGTVDLVDLSVMLTYYNSTSGFPTNIDINFDSATNNYIPDGTINALDYGQMLDILVNSGVIHRTISP
ncbi:hypothetical protein HY025_04110 [Candidatus Daviesbacteria bacterium]|nr:hypothetical protein [Candidatus Daviesbacteria bacterium]